MPLSVSTVFRGALFFVLIALTPARVASWKNDALHRRLDASSNTHAKAEADPIDYGVDVSTQIHGRLRRDTFQVQIITVCSFVP
jgi:hypothetical protein